MNVDPFAHVAGAVRGLPDICVLELFEQHVALRPDAVALVGGPRVLTYRELDGAAERQARRLRDAGVAPGETVGVYVRRSFATLIGLLAVWKAGGVYLPLDPLLPAERISFMLTDANAVAVLAEHAIADRFGDRSAGIVAFNAADDTADDRGPTVHARSITGREAPAYIIYTSGTTGVPKGVRVGHHSLLNAVLDIAAAMDCGPKDRWITLAPANFDISLAEFCIPLATGGRLVVTTDAELRDAKALVRLIAAGGVTRMQAVPSQWRMLLDAGFDGPGMITMVGGEPLPMALAVRLRGRVRKLLNGYGPTETTIVSTYWEVPEDIAKEPQISIGTPIANTRVHLTDERGEPVGPSAKGEICIAGTGVAFGYVGRPGLTSERFVHDPLGTHGARMYRTGDFGRLRADGTIEYLGRDDGQVKVRGQRIELGEVEARLAAHPGVAAAAAAVRADVLLAFVVRSADGVVPTSSQIRDFVGQLLPVSMVPNHVVFMEEFPLTPHGKIDRSALVQAFPSHPQPAAAIPETAPSTVEQWEPAIAEICREVLALPSIRLEDDLFDLGANSLALMQIAARVEASWGVAVAIEVFHDADRVRDLAAAIAEIARSSP